MEQRVTSSIQQKGLTKLLGLDYKVQYKKGVENKVADALSRQRDEVQMRGFKTLATCELSVSLFQYGCDKWLQAMVMINLHWTS